MSNVLPINGKNLTYNHGHITLRTLKILKCSNEIYAEITRFAVVMNDYISLAYSAVAVIQW